MFQDILVTGLVNGGVYALLAIGFSLIFGVARIVNIAHTGFYMLAAYALYSLAVKAGLPLAAAMPASVIGVVVVSLACYKLAIEPVRQHDAAVLIATIALALIFQESLLIAFGGHYLGVPAVADGFASILGVRVSYQRLIVLAAVAVVLLATWFLLNRTRLGLAIRATANDLEIANLMGMNVNRVAMLTVAISAALAAVAGVVVAPVFVVDPFMWLSPLVTMLAIVVRERPQRSASEPAATHPRPPIPMAKKAPSDARDSGDRRPALRYAWVRNSGIHVHMAYSSHMCPR